MSFFTGAPASANVMAIDRVVCWAIPHKSLRQFVESHSGGAHLALNIAALLARRVQEGNTRLMGMNATLSAYFGHMARLSGAKTMEAPRTGDAAEMEIPDEIFDNFARQTLGMRESEPLTNRERTIVRSKIESNEVDIVPWLEQGQQGRQLKVRLKFVQESGAPRVAVSPAASSVIAPGQPAVIRVPQVRARIAPVTAYVERPPDRLWRCINIGSWLLLPLVTAYIIFAFVPLEAREAIAQSRGFQQLPFKGLWNLFLFRAGTQSNPMTLGKDASSNLEMGISKPTGISAKMDLSKKMPSAQRIHVKIVEKGKTPVLDKVIEIPAHVESIDLFSQPSHNSQKEGF